MYNLLTIKQKRWCVLSLTLIGFAFPSVAGYSAGLKDAGHRNSNQSPLLDAPQVDQKVFHLNKKHKISDGSMIAYPDKDALTLNDKLSFFGARLSDAGSQFFAKPTGNEYQPVVAFTFWGSSAPIVVSNSSFTMFDFQLPPVPGSTLDLGTGTQITNFDNATLNQLQQLRTRIDRNYEYQSLEFGDTEDDSSFYLGMTGRRLYRDFQQVEALWGGLYIIASDVELNQFSSVAKSHFQEEIDRSLTFHESPTASPAGDRWVTDIHGNLSQFALNGITFSASNYSIHEDVDVFQGTIVRNIQIPLQLNYQGELYTATIVCENGMSIIPCTAPVYLGKGKKLTQVANLTWNYYGSVRLTDMSGQVIFNTYAGPGPQILVGQTMPGFQVTDLASGASVTPGNYVTDGKATMLGFANTSCNPCNVEIPTLNAVQSTFGSQINFSEAYVANWPGPLDSVSSLQSFVATNGITYDILYGDSVSASQMVSAYLVTSIPLHFFIDAQGTICSVFSGSPGNSPGFYDKFIQQAMLGCTVGGGPGGGGPGGGGPGGTPPPGP